MGRLIRKLRARVPAVKVVAFQDDTYLIGFVDQVVLALDVLPALWAEMGLEVNESKLKLYIPESRLRGTVPTALADKVVDSLGVLGQRLAMRLLDEWVDFTLSSSGGMAVSLAAAHCQLERVVRWR